MRKIGLFILLSLLAVTAYAGPAVIWGTTGGISSAQLLPPQLCFLDGTCMSTAAGSGSGVDSLNSLIGALSITAGSGITITPSGSTIQISSSGGGGGTYTNSNSVPNTVGGITAGTTFPSTYTLQQMFDFLLYPYIPPNFSAFALVPSSGTYREFGNPTSTIQFNSTTVRHTNPITTLSIYEDGSDIYDFVSPTPGGGAETHTLSIAISANGHLFTEKVGDGTAVTTSATLQYQFVYPYFYGVTSNAALCSSGSAIYATGSIVIPDTATVAFTSSPSSQYWFFAYPSAYPVLTEILDNSGFETISSYSVTTTNVTGLDSTSQSYRCYELMAPTTQTSFTNTFKQ